MQFLHFSIVASRLFFCRRVISVSRLDRETSGVLVAATCQEGADALTEQFKEHRVFKRYLALCTGRLEPPEGKGGWSVFWFLWMDSHFVKLICFKRFSSKNNILPNSKLSDVYQHFITAGDYAVHNQTWRFKFDIDESCFFLLFSSFPGEISAKLFISGFAEKYRVSGRNM